MSDPLREAATRLADEWQYGTADDEYCERLDVACAALREALAIEPESGRGLHRTGDQGWRMGATACWRCRECGKWSHARRDPIRHKRWHAGDGTATADGWFVWCGPFDRWTAQHDDPKPRGYVFGIGEPVSYAEKARALGEGGTASVGEVPF